MKNIFFKYIVAVFGAFFCFSSCMPEQGDRKAMIRAEVERRLDEYRTNKIQICQEELVKAATMRVDSLLIERARLNKNDLDKPVIPDKPLVPEILLPLDSSPVQPILEEEKNE